MDGAIGVPGEAGTVAKIVIRLSPMPLRWVRRQLPWAGSEASSGGSWRRGQGRKVEWEKGGVCF